MITRCIMTYPCFESLVICGNTFKHNGNGFYQSEKYINIHIVYEYTYFSIFIMILLLVMLKTAGDYQNMFWVSMNNNYINLFGKLDHLIFGLQQNNMNPSSHCRTSFFAEEFKFQNVRRDIRIHRATRNIILIFLSK